MKEQEHRDLVKSEASHLVDRISEAALERWERLDRARGKRVRQRETAR